MIPPGTAWVPLAILAALGVWAAALKAGDKRRAAARREREYLARVEADLAGTDCAELAGLLRANRERPGRPS